MLALAVLLLVTTIAFALSAISGGGAGLVVMPLLGLVVPTAEIPAALSIGTAASSITRIASFARAIRWPVVLRFVPLALPAAWAGVWLLSLLQPVYLQLALGLFLLGNLPLLLRRRAKTTSGTARTPGPWLLPLGALAGLISGFTGAVGLLFNGVYRRLGLAKEEVVATRAANEVLLHITKVGLYAYYGMLTGQSLRAGALVALGAIGGTFLARGILPYLHEATFRRIGQACAVAAGIAMIGTAGTQIAAQDHVLLHYGRTHGEAKVAMQWRAHVFAAEFENPAEIELTHFDNGTQRHATVLHLTSGRGVFVTRLPDPAGGADAV